MEFGIRDLNLMLLKIFEFREYRRREDGAFCMGCICNYGKTVREFENKKKKP